MKKKLISLVAICTILTACASQDKPTTTTSKDKKKKEPEVRIVVQVGTQDKLYTEKDIKEWYTMKGVLTIELKNGKKVKSSDYWMEYEEGEQ
ncbi:hypothetical protein Blue_044 [Bacillus phage Deep Blue]|uniref:Lipoprotein n=1 Tax=Bacillus phage Deep Blue TaxID=1792245 RepID=A0A140HLK5_9CAUD|nr:hypothetical protein Blue_044 [Bacillus phage Deep Blue]AMO25867.1 hypothetical protein Blue_044 [Bacillus phage Deep Blue]